MAIVSEADTGDSLADKVRAAMALPAGASVELYLSSDGTPIEAGATMAAQGIGDGTALDAVVSSPKVNAHHDASQPVVHAEHQVTHASHRVNHHDLSRMHAELHGEFFSLRCLAVRV